MRGFFVLSAFHVFLEISLVQYNKKMKKVNSVRIGLKEREISNAAHQQLPAEQNVDSKLERNLNRC